MEITLSNLRIVIAENIISIATFDSVKSISMIVRFNKAAERRLIKHREKGENSRSFSSSFARGKERHVSRRSKDGSRPAGITLYMYNR